MSNTETPASAIAMRGAGYYSANTVGAKHVINKAADLVLDALAEIRIEAMDGAFAIADFGAADGGTSLELMQQVVAAIRRRAPDRQIGLGYTDLPHNDFSALFRLTQGLLGEPTDHPIAATPGLFIYGCGTTFYKQLFADHSLDLCFSATAMHWISRKPGPIADHVQAVGATPAEREAFIAQGKTDWETILLHRAREMKPGGKFVVANFCVDETGGYLGNTGGVNMFDTFAKHWRALRDSGRISDAEYRAATFQQFYRTKAEFSAPFEDPNSTVRKAGLVLDRAFTTRTRCPYAEAFEQHGDAAAFARAYVPTLRSWSETVFAGALDPTRPAQERAAIVDAFYGAYEAEVAAHPQGHAMDYVHCFMKISKTPASQG